MRNIIAYFIKYPITGNLLMVLTLGFGLAALFSLKSSFFPPEAELKINIDITYLGASPEEIEEGVITKIEDNLKGVTGIDRISSKSAENGGQLVVEMLLGYNIDLVLQDVKNAVDQINSFPVGMEPPVVYKVENVNKAIDFALRGDVDLRTLKKYARDIENDLRSIPGISKVELKGFPDEEIEISFRENDLRAYNLSFAQAANAVRKANLQITGGTIKSEKEELLIRADYKGYYALEMENIVVKTNADGGVVRLRDVANVQDEWSDNPNRSFLNGEPAVIITVSNTREEDILYITDYIRNYITEFNDKALPVTIDIIDDESVNLRERIDLLVENGRTGVILVLVLLALFLNIHLAFWVAMGIPISFMGMFMFGIPYDLTINVISLFGMIIVIGILVDDGIVVAENIYQHYEKGKSATQAAIDGTMEVVPAVFTGVFTTVIAFSAFFFFDGRTGDFFKNMAFVVIMTLLFSLIEGFLILPAHVAHSRALKGDYKTKKPNWLEARMNKVFDFIREKIYAPVLRFALLNKALALAVFVGLFILSIGMMGSGIVKFTFFPVVEQNNVQVKLRMPAGTREDITQEWLDKIEQGAIDVNKSLREELGGQDVVQVINKNLGPSTYQGNVTLILIDAEQRGDFRSTDIANMIQKKVGEIPNAEEIIYGIANPFGKPISVSMQSFDREQLSFAANELREEMEKLSDINNVVDTDRDGLREVNIELKEKAYQLGLQVQDVVGQVRQGFFGEEVQRLQRGLDEVKVWVRYGEQDRSSIEKLEEMRIRVNNQSYPLKELVKLSIDRGIVEINRLDTRREIRVEADLAKVDASASEIQSYIASDILPSILKKYPNVRYNFEGQSRETQKTGKSAGVVMPIVLISMFVLVILTFRSIWQPTVIFLLLIFGFIGVVFGHFIHGAPVSVLSILGMVALIGVMINDSLVLVSAMNNFLKEGKDFDTAVFEAGLSRLRPITLTSATTIAGLGPLILEKSFQAQFLIPMAISLAYGLLAATFISLIALPVSLVILNRAKILLTWLWEGQKPTAEMVEPAIKELKTEHH